MKFRTIQRSIHEDLIQAAIQRCQSQEGNTAELLRRTQAEGTFAHIKEVLKLRKLYSLDLESAGKRFLMACVAINLKKLIQAFGILRRFFYNFVVSLKNVLYLK